MPVQMAASFVVIALHDSQRDASQYSALTKFLSDEETLSPETRNPAGEGGVFGVAISAPERRLSWVMFRGLGGERRVCRGWLRYGQCGFVWSLSLPFHRARSFPSQVSKSQSVRNPAGREVRIGRGLELDIPRRFVTIRVTNG